MKLSIVLISCRGVVTPVPGAAGVLENDRTPKSLLKLSSGSSRLNAIGALSAGVSSLSPKSWSMNWPHTQPHCETPFSEKRFCPVSSKTRLLM
jgi:hypothetical protein